MARRRGAAKASAEEEEREREGCPVQVQSMSKMTKEDKCSTISSISTSSTAVTRHWVICYHQKRCPVNVHNPLARRMAMQWMGDK